MPYRLAIFETHPIQYKVPWFRALSARPELDLTVFYCMLPDARQQGAGFGVDFAWDVPLLEGYRYVVLENVSSRPGVTHFGGCDTPALASHLVEHSSASVPRGRRTRFDAMIINGWVVKSCLQALWACQRAGIPAVLRCEACDLQPRAWWKTLVHRVLLRQFSAFIAIGTANRLFYLHRGVPAGRIVDGAYCVENERFAARCPRSERGSLRRRWGISEAAVCFVFCGKLEAKKRPLDVLRAIATPAGCPDSVGVQGPGSASPLSLHLLMVGDGALRTECEAYAQAHHLPVTFTGFLNQSEMPNAYAAADCLVLPSDYGETWGLVVNEAMACGLPAITSERVGCHPDLIVPGHTGATFPCGDIAALAGLLRRFAAAPETLRAMGDHAREHVRAYSVENLVNGTLAALRLAATDVQGRPA